jgi:hypothetical protein
MSIKRQAVQESPELAQSPRAFLSQTVAEAGVNIHLAVLGVELDLDAGFLQ